MGEKLTQLKEHLSKMYDLNYAAAVLEWDQEVSMPPGGVAARSEQLATLYALSHEIFTSEETARLLEEAEAEVANLDYDSDEASLARVTRREHDKQVKIPNDLVAELARLRTVGFAAWREAREEDNFVHFEPHLDKMLGLQRQIADILGYEAHPYDALLDFYETGMKTAQVKQLFDELKAGLTPLLQAIVKHGKPIDATFLERTYPPERQWDLTLSMLHDIGYDFERGRQDKAAHPFTTNFSCNDVRVTTRLLPNRPQSSIFSSVHEGGHALYEQGIPEKFERTPLAGGATLGLHESQSRMWENRVARSRSFWQYYFPIMRAFFPEQLAGVTREQLVRAINQVQPDFIRVEADEVTYNMHIFVRFELEQALVTGDLKVADVPAAWNAKYQEYLGIVPANDSEGCLQDVHWSHGYIGYFPTYTLGNLISAQLYRRAKAEIPGLETGFAQGQFSPLLNWLRQHVHVHGSKFTASELLERELGEPISTQPWLDYIRTKYAEIYEI